MDIIQLGEPIAVEAVFNKGKFSPVWFIFSGQKHMVKKVQFFWKERKGRDTFYIFSVTDENNTVYKICFNPQSLDWRLLLDA